MMVKIGVISCHFRDTADFTCLKPLDLAESSDCYQETDHRRFFFRKFLAILVNLVKMSATSQKTITRTTTNSV